MPSLKTYDLFISHAWDYGDDYHRIVQFLHAAPNFKWRNYSVPEHDPLAGGAELGDQLQGQIKPTNAVIILAGMYVNHRDWIQYEIDLARAYAKPIIGVRPWGQQRTPAQVAEAAATMVGWNTDSIVAAVRAHAL